MFSASADTSRFSDALRERARRVQAATRRATLEAGHTVEAETKRTLTRYAHPAGTPTPSPRGQPPAVVTGTLRRSLRVGVLRQVSPGVVTIDVGPTTVYARIQELGGRIVPRRASALAFRIDGHWVRVQQVKLPARPYLAPTVKRLAGDGRILDIYDRAWARALGGDA